MSRREPIGRAFVPTLVLIGMVVSVISSLGAPLIPSLAREFGADLGSTQWSLTVTMLVGAVASPIVGRLGDGPHRRAVLLGSLGAVVLGGALAALAGSLPLLIAGRALQGMGLALMPLTMATARDHLPPEQAGRTIAALSVTGAVGVGLGYPITGFIAEYLDASAAFWFGTAASAAALLLAVLFVPATPSERRADRIDVTGAGLVAVGLVALLIGLEKGADWGWGSDSTLGLLAAAAVVLALWVRHELRVAAPLVDLRLVRHRAVLTANVTGLLLGVAMYLGISLMTQFVQFDGGLDATVFVAGLTLVPLSALSAVSSGLVPVIERRFGARATIPLGALVISVAAGFFALTGSALWHAFVTMALVGVGLGCTFAAMPGLIVGAVPASETSSAMSLYQVTRYVGFSIGSGLAVTLLRAFGGDGGPTVGAYRDTFAAAAVLSLFAAAVAWILPGRAPRPAPDAQLRRREQEEGLVASAGLESDPSAR
ncbi:MFS transporter [Patulibacter defluvii]|uniref:MFS transporter n=1 Tax=Patulibacter defluvii TaxID=3095358 RepID=UPI002A759E07|nr:MFS transporter [Patulibacter sp. DM4]